LPTEREWEHDRDRFVTWWQQRPAEQRLRTVADDRSALWSPLARQFAELGRDLFAAPTLAGTLQRLVEAARFALLGTDLAALSLRGPDGLATLASTDDARAADLDALQREHEQGPVVDATAADGTGLSATPDLTDGAHWPRFAPAAADRGVRGVLAVGAFPVHDERRAAALSIYSREPRGLAAADPDVAVVLAAFAATAVSSTGATTAEEIHRATSREPLRSCVAVERAVDLLTRKRHLPPDDVYDVLRHASAQLRASRSV
jgi:hypothetical protein